MSQPITITSNDFSAIYTHIYMTMAIARPTILNNKYISDKLDMQNRHHYYSSSADHCGSAHDQAVDKKNKAVIMSTRSGTSKGVKLSTDPQSVAARERRHRISDRFKILQSMVPGGTRMDTVSMLDEAIHYVKFLKTQIWLHQAIFNNNNNNNVVKDFNPEQQMLLISNHVNTAGNVTDHQLYGSNLEGPSLACYHGDDGVELSSE